MNPIPEHLMYCWLVENMGYYMFMLSHYVSGNLLHSNKTETSLKIVGCLMSQMSSNSLPNLIQSSGFCPSTPQKLLLSKTPITSMLPNPVVNSQFSITWTVSSVW